MHLIQESKKGLPIWKAFFSLISSVECDGMIFARNDVHYSLNEYR